MPGYVDVFSPVISKPKLIFKTNFGNGFTIDPVLMLGTPGDAAAIPPIPGAWTQGWSYFRNTDAGYGYGFNSLTAYFGPKTLFFVQQLPTYTMPEYTSAEAATKLATLFNVSIQDTTMPVVSGGKELAITLIKRGADVNPQSPLILQRCRDDYGGANAIPVPAVKSIAWKYNCILDPNLANLVADDFHYLVQHEIKTGDMRSTYPAGSYSTSVGSYRFVTNIFKGAGGLYFSSYCDNVAGVVNIYPREYNAKPGFFWAPFTLSTLQINKGDIVKGKSSGVIGIAAFVELRLNTWTGGNGRGALVITDANGIFLDGEKLQINVAGTWTNACTVVKYYSGLEDDNFGLVENKYRVNATPVGSVPLGVPLEFATRIVFPSSRTDLTGGVTQSVMTNLSTGEKLTLCDFRGGIQMGAGEDPLTRLIVINPYSSHNKENFLTDPSIGLTHKITNLEIWDDFPEPIIN